MGIGKGILRKIAAVAGLLLAVLALFYINDRSAPTPAQAIAKLRTIPGWTIVAERSVPSGLIAFTYRAGNNGGIYGAEYVRRTWKGWKWGFGGMHSSGLPAVSDSEQRQLDRGWTEQYLPATSGAPFGESPFPMLFGVIRDPQIASVEVLVPGSAQPMHTELLPAANGTRMWMLLLPAADGTRFELRALSKDAVVLSTKQVDERRTSGGSGGTHAKDIPS